MGDECEWMASVPLSRGRLIAGRFAMIGGTLAPTDEVRFTRGDIRSVDAAADRPPRPRITTTDGGRWS